jgi:hypothetical protein
MPFKEAARIAFHRTESAIFGKFLPAHRSGIDFVLVHAVIVIVAVMSG